MAEAAERVEMAREIKEQTAKVGAYVDCIRYILRNRADLAVRYATDLDGLLGHLVDHYMDQADEVLTDVQVRAQELLKDPRKEA